VLLPTASIIRNICLPIRSLMSLIAASFDHFAIFAHLDEVSLPSNPSGSLLISLRCLSFIMVFACLFQKSALCGQHARFLHIY